MDQPLPDRARVVIIGGGVTGCSIAYHLAQLGWNDVVLLERAQLTSGTTWHAAGLLTTLRDTETQTRPTSYTQELYRRLEAEAGQATGLIECGSIQLALTPAKAEEMRRGFRAAQSFGIECEEIGPADVQRPWPLAHGRAPMDVWSVNIRRAHAWQNNPRYLADRVVESLGIGYQDHWPFRQWQTARGVKRGILYDRLAAAGACFGESAGWERPNWYARPGQLPVYEYGWGRQNWFANNAEEHRAVRERIGLFEQSSFAKLLVQGRDAERALNRIATADCRVPVGKSSIRSSSTSAAASRPTSASRAWRRTAFSS